jgi:hypothetical protein
MDFNDAYRRRKSTVTDSPAHSLPNCCWVCGQPATKAWHGETTLAICSFCALESLPALIADAVQIVGQRDSELRDIFARIESRFWRAMALRLHRQMGNDA